MAQGGSNRPLMPPWPHIEMHRHGAESQDAHLPKGQQARRGDLLGLHQTSVFDLEMAGGASKFKSSKIVGSIHGTSFILTLICSLRVKRSRK